MLERIIVNQIEVLLDSQVQDDFEKDLTARQRKYLRRTHAVSSGREKPVSALTYACLQDWHLWLQVAVPVLLGGTYPPSPLKTILD